MSGDSNRSVGAMSAVLMSGILVLATPGFAESAAGAGPDSASYCAAAPHRVELEPTGHAPGASGWMELRFGNAPYGVAVTEDGSYRYQISLGVTSLPPNRREAGALVAWAATPSLDRHVNLGAVGDDGTVAGEVSWNKFLVFVTVESAPDVDTWKGPILMKATSPSGNMHTMAGHGIFQQHGIGC